MPRIKKKLKTPTKKTPSQVAIEEKLASCGRGELENIVFVGELVEKTLKSDFGAILKALTAGRISMELQSNKDGKLSSERLIGRLEMAEQLWNDLEQYVLDKDRLKTPQQAPREVDYHTAQDPEPPTSTSYGQF